MIRRRFALAITGLIVLVAALVGVGLTVADTGAIANTMHGTPIATPTPTQGHGDAGHDDGGSGGGDGGMGSMMDMQMVSNGTIVNENTDELPPSCEELAGEQTVTVRGGNRFAEAGEMFTFDNKTLQVEPCTRLTVTFVNEDSVRHQWMIHGLPKETYPMGMFNIEVNGPGRVTATLITPAEDMTLHTHCSLPQHEQKGMHMDLVVGDGGNGHGGADHGGHGA